MAEVNFRLVEGSWKEFQPRVSDLNSKEQVQALFDALHKQVLPGSRESRKLVRYEVKALGQLPGNHAITLGQGFKARDLELPKHLGKRADSKPRLRKRQKSRPNSPEPKRVKFEPQKSVTMERIVEKTVVAHRSMETFESTTIVKGPDFPTTRVGRASKEFRIARNLVGEKLFGLEYTLWT